MSRNYDVVAGQLPVVPCDLHQLRIDIQDGCEIAITDGEDKAAHLHKWDIPVTSIPSIACLNAHIGVFRDANIMLLPNNNPQGRKKADEIGTLLMGVAKRIRVLNLPELNGGGNTRDWFANGHTYGEFVELWKRAPLWKPLPPQPTTTTQPAPSPKHEVAARQWADPHPLPDSLLPVAKFDLTLMPEKLRPWVEDIAQRMQCPPDYVAVSLMTAVASVIGLQVAIRPKIHDDWTITPNLWAMPIGRPGMLKSPAMEAAIWPLKKLAAAAIELHKGKIISFEVEEKTVKLLRAANEEKAKKILKENRNADVSSLLGGGGEQTPPILRRYMANDTNVASLGVLLQQNPNGLLVHRDEIIAMLVNLDREDRIDEREFYLTAWNGDSWRTTDRIGRGLNNSIEKVCLSVLGSTQPAKISPYLARTIRGGHGGDGLIQRFSLMVWPDIAPEWENIDRWPNAAAKKSVMEVFDQLDHIDPAALGAKRDRDPFSNQEEGLPYLRLSIEGYNVFHTWLADLEKRLRSGDLHHALESHLGKYRKLVPALALVLDLADRITGPADQMSGPVGAQAVETAIRWAKYLETHARRAYGSVSHAAADTAKVILAKIRTGALKNEFRSHDVWRPGWSKLTDRETVEPGLQMLIDYDWLATEKVETSGRPTIVYKLNPKAKL